MHFNSRLDSLLYFRITLPAQDIFPTKIPENIGLGVRIDAEGGKKSEMEFNKFNTVL
jgi:hypothetical protein